MEQQLVRLHPLHVHGALPFPWTMTTLGWISTWKGIHGLRQASVIGNFQQLVKAGPQQWKTAANSLGCHEGSEPVAVVLSLTIRKENTMG